MPVDEEKKIFVIKYTFTDVKNMKNDVRHFGKEEKHFNIPWNIYIVPYESNSMARVVLSCHKLKNNEKWSIDTTIIGEFVTSAGVKLPVRKFEFSESSEWPVLNGNRSIVEHLVDGNLTVECHVTIDKTTGIKFPIFLSFNNDKSKEFSDAVLIVLGQKFHVNRMYLAYHSAYFKSLFFGNFDESKQSEVELKDIDAWDFQKFLEVLYGEPAIDEDNAEMILQLADMYDAKSVIHQCEQFCLYKSKQDLKFKFNMAVKYNMNELQKKCISELKSVED